MAAALHHGALALRHGSTATTTALAGSDIAEHAIHPLCGVVDDTTSTLSSGSPDTIASAQDSTPGLSDEVQATADRG